MAGALVGTVLEGFHATMGLIRFDAVNVVFSGMGLLAVAGGVYARISLRDELEPGPGAQRRDARTTSRPKRGRELMM